MCCTRDRTGVSLRQHMESGVRNTERWTNAQDTSQTIALWTTYAHTGLHIRCGSRSFRGRNSLLRMQPNHRCSGSRQYCSVQCRVHATETNIALKHAHWSDCRSHTTHHGMDSCRRRHTIPGSTKYSRVALPLANAAFLCLGLETPGRLCTRGI